MNMHKHAKLTPLGRERRVKMMLDGHTPAKAAAVAGVSPATVSRVLKQAGLSRLKDLEPAEPARRSAAGSRRRSTPYIPVGVFPDSKQHSALAHLKAALACYRRLGVTVKRVMTDNGPCDTSHAFAGMTEGSGIPVREPE